MAKNSGSERPCPLLKALHQGTIGPNSQEGILFAALAELKRLSKLTFDSNVIAAHCQLWRGGAAVLCSQSPKTTRTFLKSFPSFNENSISFVLTWQNSN
jgi:hypothetical protein